MKGPLFDKDGYPTEETLKFIEEYEEPEAPVQLIEFLLSAWHWPDYAKWEPPNLELHTGGWSGNEMLIQALQSSKSLFWLFYWQKSERGGHYYFKLSAG
jgi:hypothetical protein